MLYYFVINNYVASSVWIPGVGITEEKIRVASAPLSLKHSTIVSAVSGVGVTVICEV